MSDIARQRAERLASLPFEVVGSSYRSFFSGTGDSLRQLWQQRELLGMLVRRELKARYKDSSLGFLWSLIRPIMLLLVYYFAIGKVLNAQASIPMFAIFVFSGLTLWGLFNEILTSATQSILTNAGLIKKVYVPREVFPLASVGSALFNFGVQLGVLVVAILAFGQFTWSWDIFYFFPAVIVVLLFGAGLGILLSALNVYLRDVQYLVDVATLLLFWASPVVYSFTLIARSDFANTWVESVYLLNPITVAILAFQRAMWLPGPSVQEQFAKMGVSPASAYPPDLDLRLIILMIIGVVFIWISHRIFLRLQGNFAQEI